MPPSNRFFQFFSEIGRAFLQTKFLPVGSFLGHMSIEKKIQIGPTVLALKLDKGRMLGGGGIKIGPTVLALKLDKGRMLGGIKLITPPTPPMIKS